MIRFVLLAILVVCSGGNQATVDYIGSFVAVKLDPLDNTDRDAEDYVPVWLSLRNTGDVAITYGDWKIYFNIMYGAKIEDTVCDMHLGHVNGLLYYLKPFQSFSLQAYQNISCTIRIFKHGSARSDFMPNWYVASSNFTPHVIQSTASEEIRYVGAFDSQPKWKTDPRDRNRPLSAADRFEKNTRNFPKSKKLRIIPSPLKMTEDTGFVKISDDWKIINSYKFPRASIMLSKTLNLTTEGQKDNTIKVFEFVNEQLDVFKGETEAYNLEVHTTEEVIKIIAVSDQGAFYAVQTIIQLLSRNKYGDKVMPCVTIHDRPRYRHRGLMIDLARNFHGKSINSLIDNMANYKMNKLHLHVTDDEGWRLEIPSIPNLTNIGSRRCHGTTKYPSCLIPSHGSGPFSNTSGTGYITTGEFRQILQHAENNFISITLEIDMPGHSRAAWRSVNSHHKISSEGIDDISYRLDDLDDIGEETKEFRQRWKRSALNPCVESTYEFIDIVVNDIVRMYRGIQKLKQIHIGGDEVIFTEWVMSKACRKYFGNMTVEAMKMMFINKTVEIITKHGLEPVLWEDGVYENGQPVLPQSFASAKVTAQTWFGVWELGRGSRPIELANLGFDVIMSPATHLYLDHAQEPDPEDRGLYWATRFSDMHKVFSFNAHNIYKNIQTSRFGESLNSSFICSKFSCPELTIPDRIKGLEACVWTETIRTEKHLYHMLFPRLLAVAERAWHEAKWETMENDQERNLMKQTDWDEFRSTVGNKHLAQLPSYSVPPPGAIIVNGKLLVNVLFDNHVVEVSVDCSSVWSIIADHFEIPKFSKSVCLRSRPVERQIYSRTITLNVNSDSNPGASLWGKIPIFITLSLFTVYTIFV